MEGPVISGNVEEEYSELLYNNSNNRDNGLEYRIQKDRTIMKKTV